MGFAQSSTHPTRWRFMVSSVPPRDIVRTLPPPHARNSAGHEALHAQLQELETDYVTRDAIDDGAIGIASVSGLPES
jgi:hypothetical protein